MKKISLLIIVLMKIMIVSAQDTIDIKYSQENNCIKKIMTICVKQIVDTEKIVIPSGISSKDAIKYIRDSTQIIRLYIRSEKGSILSFIGLGKQSSIIYEQLRYKENKFYLEHHEETYSASNLLWFLLILCIITFFTTGSFDMFNTIPLKMVFPTIINFIICFAFIPAFIYENVQYLTDMILWQKLFFYYLLIELFTFLVVLYVIKIRKKPIL